jgi:hypothetical protein
MLKEIIMKGMTAKVQRDQLVRRLRAKDNPALKRLAKAVETKQSHQDMVNYSRMHHRHNRK